jgi:hypothetical protein
MRTIQDATIVDNDVVQHVDAYTVSVLTVAQHESGTSKVICWSVTIYNTKYPVNPVVLLILDSVQD